MSLNINILIYVVLIWVIIINVFVTLKSSTIHDVFSNYKNLTMRNKLVTTKIDANKKANKVIIEMFAVLLLTIVLVLLGLATYYTFF